MTLKQMLALKAKVESLRRKADELRGAEEQLRKQLKQDYNCGSVEDAKKLLEKLNEDEGRLSRSYERELIKFEKGWGEKLEEGI